MSVAIPRTQEIEKFKTLTISVVSPESEAQARRYLTDVRLATKQLKTDIELLKKPHLEYIKSIETAAAPWKTILAERDQAIEKAIVDYNRKVRLEIDERNRKEALKYEKKVERVETKAVAEGKPMPLVLPPAQFAPPPKTVDMEGAKQTTVKRKDWKLPVMFQTLVETPEKLSADTAQGLKSPIPLEFFLLDTSRIGKVVRAGGSIPGIEVFEVESIAVKGT